MERDLRLIVTLLLAACDAATTAPARPDAPSFAATVNHTNEFTEDVNAFLDVPCANGGAGETVHITGSTHLVIQSTVTPAGMTLLSGLSQPFQLTAVGTTTGDVYHDVGSSQFADVRSDAGFPIAFTELVDTRMIGPGPDNNLTLHETFHITLNANGILTVEVFNRRLTCN